MVVSVSDVISRKLTDNEDEVYIGLKHLEETSLIETQGMDNVSVRESDEGKKEVTGSIGDRPRYSLTAVGEDYCSRVLRMGRTEGD